MTSRAVVLGGCGFLGSYLVDALVERGKPAVVVDRNPTDYWGGQVEIEDCDILSSTEMARIFGKSDVILNFAGLADLESAFSNAAASAELNVLATARTLSAARDVGAKKYVFASSVYALGNISGFYGASKRAAEEFVAEFQAQGNINTLILRFGSLFGPRSNRLNGLYALVREAMADGSVSIGGREDEYREYIHARDAAELTLDLLESGDPTPVVTVTGAQRLALPEVKTMLEEILDRKLASRPSPPRQGHYRVTPARYADKTSKKLTPNPGTDFAEGLLELMDSVAEEKSR